MTYVFSEEQITQEFLKEHLRTCTRNTLIMDDIFSSEQWRIIHYLNFKMECLAKQEDYGLAIDKDSIQKHIDELQSQKDPIISSLTEAMPKVPQYRKKSKPKVTHKKDGTLSKLGEEWFRLLKANKLPMNYSGDLEILT